MKSLSLLLLASCVALAFAQGPPLFSPSKAFPQTTVEPELLVSRNDWVNQPYIPFTSVFLPFAQTDSTVDMPIPLLTYSKPVDVDFIGNAYVFGALHDKQDTGPDDDHYSYVLDQNASLAVLSAPFFGYPLIPACKACKDMEIHTLFFGPQTVPDSYVGNVQVPLSQVPSWVSLPPNMKLLSSVQMDISSLPCDHFEPVQNATFCVPRSILNGCTGGFPATTVMTSPPYTPYCNFSDALVANYNPASPTGVYGPWPAGTYRLVIYEKRKQAVTYGLHLGYRGMFEAILPYAVPTNQGFSIQIDAMPPRLAAAYTVGNFWADLVRYHSTVRFNKCKEM